MELNADRPTTEKQKRFDRRGWWLLSREAVAQRVGRTSVAVGVSVDLVCRLAARRLTRLRG
jgi:hypothetical protein